MDGMDGSDSLNFYNDKSIFGANKRGLSTPDHANLLKEHSKLPLKQL